MSADPLDTLIDRAIAACDDDALREWLTALRDSPESASSDDVVRAGECER